MPVVANAEYSFTLILQQDSTGGRTVIWPTGVYWSNGVTPTLAATRGNFDVFASPPITAAPPGSALPWHRICRCRSCVLVTLEEEGFPPPPLSSTALTIPTTPLQRQQKPALAGALPACRHRTSSFGYFGGGTAGPADVATVDRIDYSNDTATLVAKGPLSSIRTFIAAAGNSSFGYFGGGQTPAPAIVATVDRIDYSNDTATAVTKGPLSAAR